MDFNFKIITVLAEEVTAIDPAIKTIDFFTNMNVLSMIGHDVASTTSFGSRKRARSNDVTTTRMPRAKRKCGLCGEEGKLSHTVHIVS